MNMTTSCKVKSTYLSPGGQGTAVTISGTGFDLSNNEVTVGGADCAVTLHSSASLECTMSVGPNGPQSVSVRVPSKGLASGSLTFTFSSAVSSISPTSGSLEGWSVLMCVFSCSCLPISLTIPVSSVVKANEPTICPLQCC